MLLLASAATVHPQATVATIPYFCDFENATERGNWQFANSLLNEWVIGNSDHSGGLYGLYVSYIGSGNNTFYFLDTTNSYAYRRIHFPAGLYNISFDWRYNSITNYIYYTYIRAFLIPATTTFVGGQRYPGLSASRLPQGAIPIDLSGSQLIFRNTWSRFSNALVQVPATNDYYLVFFFTNNGQLANLYPSYTTTQSPAIDNIRIDAVACSTPFALTVANLGGGCVSLDWDDRQLPANQTWEIEYGPHGFLPGTGATVAATARPHTMCGLQDDTIYDFYVRSHCSNGFMSNYSDALTYRYSSETSPCRDFSNLKATGTLCTFGQYEEFNDTIGEVYGPYAETGIINYGSANYGDPNTLLYGSRHTVHTNPYELDSCSGYRLHTVPKGDNWSVRLGTVYGKWICQSITYDIAVDSAAADLLMLKYACVLYNPDAHVAIRKPRFLLEVLDSSNTLIDRGCYFADFTPDNITSDTSWQIGTDRYIYWHDWTPVGLNVASYHGQAIKVRLTTYSCGQGADAHFGYAYFNLKCQKSRIKAIVCGYDNSPYYAQFCAPEGFRYSWYSPDKPGFSSSDQKITAALDGAEYFCDVFFGNDTSNCKFTLSVIANHDLVERQYTHASFSYTKDTFDCKYKALLANGSFSSNFDSTDIAYDCDFFFWDFGDGTTSTSLQDTIAHTFPAHGTYTVMLVAGRNALGCYDTCYKSITFAAPEMPTIHTDTIVCYGTNNRVWVDGQTIVGYAWNTGDTTRQIERVMLVPYTFSVRTTDLRGCETELSVFVNVMRKPQLKFDTINYAGCNPLQVTVSDLSPQASISSYKWNWGDGTESTEGPTARHTYHTPGRYNILAYSETIPGCSDTALLHAYSFDYTKADFRWHSFFGKITLPNMAFENISAPHEPEQNTYKWEFYRDSTDGSPHDVSYDFEPQYHWPVSDNNDVGFYRVRLVAYTNIRVPETEFLCLDSIDYTIYIFNDFLQFPNVITPNGDGINDIFEIKNLLDGGNYTDNELFIFNHWGRLVYYKKNITTREDFWDPSLTNEMTGTYYYRFSAKGHTGNVQRNGVVELLR